MYTIIKTTKLNSVNVEAYLADLLAHIRRRLPGFLLLQDPNDLLFRELSLPHRPPPALRTLPKSGGVSEAQVICHPPASASPRDATGCCWSAPSPWRC
jgi:hypothetical protein